MIIALAQFQSLKGDLFHNAHAHEACVREAVARQARLIVFPELSLSGYEPTLASQLAITNHHPFIGRFQQICDENQIAIAFGVPIRNENGIMIGMPVLRPMRPPLMYTKQYLHEDEFPFFVPGENIHVIDIEDQNVAFSICYEISVAAHEEKAFKASPGVYIASVVKSVGGIDNALQRLSSLAVKHRVPVLMVNSVGESDGFQCAGKTSVWTADGTLSQQLGSNEPGLLYFDTVSGKSFVHQK